MAREVISEDLARRTEEEKKRKLEEEAKKQEENRKSLIADFSNKASIVPSNSHTLDAFVTNTYQDLVKLDSFYKRVARRLGINYSSDLSASNIKQSVLQIQDNLKAIQEKLISTPVTANTSFADISSTSNELLPLFDAICSSISNTSDFSKVVDAYKLQTDEALKRNLYFKVQNVIKDARIQKCLKEREEINKEPISFWGKLTGKSTLKTERLRNVYLKLKLAQSDVPVEQDKYSTRQMLADLYACAMTEFGGNFTPEMDKLYAAISETYGIKGNKSFSQEYIHKLAEPKITQTQSANLPTVQGKFSRFFGKTKTQIATMQAANQILEEKLEAKQPNKKPWNYAYSKPSVLSSLEKKLKEIASNTSMKDTAKTKTNLRPSFVL